MPRALLSVYDKSGIDRLAKGLVEHGWDLISSGGTAKAIAASGVSVTDVAEMTGYPAILGHRVVTLHPLVHGALLADPTDPDHQADMATYGIEPISLVVANLYPFGDQPGIEMIDIGGPTMVRAAAKNHAHVGIVVDPGDYDLVLEELAGSATLGGPTRRRLARKAFAHTAAYDAAIVGWLDATDEESSDPLAPSLHFAAKRVQDLRYGENPHQVGARYRFEGTRSWWDDAVQHGGKDLSYLNLYDTEAAWRLAWSLSDDPTAVVIKHANPCGVAVAADIADAYRKAHDCDSTSAFGGIIAVNRPVSVEMAEAVSDVFTEVVVAPSFEPGALDKLTEKKNLRVLEARAPVQPELDVRSIEGGLLVQTNDPVSRDESDWKVVTQRAPSDAEMDDLRLAWQVCARVTSNTIVLVKDRQAVGIGAGQQNRRDAGRIAADKADGRAVGGACASDAFFPFRDGLDAAIDAGATTVIQPGGSVRDEEVIAAADEADMAMIFTGQRHFRH
jgi:phosphoribosylaminoimidazolecarboxamide formyltransferase/IMP cyclohydrolase